VGIARGDGHGRRELQAPAGERHVDPLDRPVQDVGEEDLDVIALVIDRHPPRAAGRRDAAEAISVAVQQQERALAERVGGPVGARQAANDHVALLQHRQGLGQSHVLALEEQGRRAGRRIHLDDRRAGPLKSGGVVEVRDQDIARVELAPVAMPAGSNATP